MLWTEAAFSARLAWHWPDRIIDNAINEWRGRLRTCVRAKDEHFEQLLWQHKAIWQETFQFLSNVTWFLDCFFGNYQKFELPTFASTEGMVKSIIWKYNMSFVGNLLLFSAVKELWKSVKNWQSYRHEFVVLLFWTQCIYTTGYICKHFQFFSIHNSSHTTCMTRCFSTIKIPRLFTIFPGECNAHLYWLFEGVNSRLFRFVSFLLAQQETRLVEENTTWQSFSLLVRPDFEVTLHHQTTEWWQIALDSMTAATKFNSCLHVIYFHLYYTRVPTRRGSTLPWLISIWYGYFWPKISPISLSFTVVLFRLFIYFIIARKVVNDVSVIP